MRKEKKNKRKILWYNPPYNSSVATNIGKRFLSLLDTHFPPNHQLRKIINRNCVKLSYSCCKNMRSIILTHNQKLLSNKPKPHEEMSCNCRKKEACVLNNNCQSGPIVYQATVFQDSEPPKKYIGSTQNFKERYNSHKTSFREETYQHATTLSKYIWEKKLNPSPNIKWEILQHATTYNPGRRYCDLCLSEKLFISKYLQDPNHLNKRSDLATKCRHRARFKLENI